MGRKKRRTYVITLNWIKHDSINAQWHADLIKRINLPYNVYAVNDHVLCSSGERAYEILLNPYLKYKNVLCSHGTRPFKDITKEVGYMREGSNRLMRDYVRNWIVQGYTKPSGTIYCHGIVEKSVIKQIEIRALLKVGEFILCDKDILYGSFTRRDCKRKVKSYAHHMNIEDVIYDDVSVVYTDSLTHDRENKWAGFQKRFREEQQTKEDYE